MKHLTAKRRRRLYEVSIAACGLGVVYGLFTSEQALLWMGLAAAVFGVARANVNDEG